MFWEFPSYEQFFRSPTKRWPWLLLLASPLSSVCRVFLNSKIDLGWDEKIATREQIQSLYSADGIHYQWILFYPDFAASLTSNFRLLGQSEENRNITQRALNETPSFSTSLRFSGQRMNEGDLRSRRRSRILSCRISRYKWSPNRVFLAQHTQRMAVHIHCWINGHQWINC